MRPLPFVPTCKIAEISVSLPVAYHLTSNPRPIMRYSIVIPVYNRPDELEELLQSLTTQRFHEFEVIVVEDGSSLPANQVCAHYTTNLNLLYLTKPNSGPGPSRNYGAERATGDYVIVLDSDCILPEGWLEAIEDGLQKTHADAFGGPDRAHPDFSPIQKAINYSMTSFFTTGGIRGGKKRADKFYPRSFNMGVRRTVWNTLQGFAPMRFGEDIDFSIRLYQSGYHVRLFPTAWVWHKRRANFRQFFKQVHNSGIARINLYKKYPSSLKIVHTLPALFTIGLTGSLLLSVWHWWFLLPVALYILLLFCDALYCTHNLKVAALSVIAAFIQLTGYGTGFLSAFYRRILRHDKAFSRFEKTFYD